MDRADVDQDQNTTELIALYYHGNRQGSVSHLTRDDGVVVESYDYTPFGIPTIYDSQGQVVSSSPTGNRFLYTGREWDHEIQLYHYRARTYDPHYGVFLQEDPLRFDAGVNLVAYAAASPTNLTDPTGLISMREFGSAVLDFLKEAGHELAAIGVATIPFLEEILDLLSAATGKDLSEWAEDGFRGRPDSLGFWDRVKYAAIGAAKLIGSAVGVGILRKLDKLIDYLRNCNRAKGRIGTAATNLAKRLGLKVGCFALGTLVLTPDGLVPIEEIRPGDEVIASSPGGPDEVHRVLATPTATGTFEMVRLTIQSELGVEEIVATTDHPFWSETRQRWVPAEDLGLGESLSNKTRVMAKEWSSPERRVFNLVVAQRHSYLVGRQRTLVHNGCGETAATIRGKLKHKEFAEKVKGKGWKSEQRIAGTRLRPDAIDPKGRPVELKPNTPSGRAAGKRQIEKYKAATGTNGRVIYYD
ncbi:MAG: RHS repeat-associated core domain-containing protein [Planctomycetota bacterium]